MNVRGLRPPQLQTTSSTAVNEYRYHKKYGHRNNATEPY